MQEFDQKVAFVTGAGGGMGYRVACDLLAAGAKVLMFDLKPQPETIPRDSDQSIYVQGDLTDEAEVATACARAIDAFGGIDCLANVAGALWFGRDRSALEMELDVWDQVMAINLKSMVHTARHVVPSMRMRGGQGRGRRLFQIASDSAGRRPHPLQRNLPGTHRVTDAGSLERKP